MDKKEIKQVLQCPTMELLSLALALVNLKDKEVNAITLVDIKGSTEDVAAEELRCSKKSIQNWRRTAYSKLGKAWKNNNLINTILDL
jgi:predicted DNA-binding protein (UPF0251 family)